MNCDLLVDAYNLSKCKSYFSQPLNVNGVNEVWQTEMHTTDPLVCERSFVAV
jgi:hypothetical protein